MVRPERERLCTEEACQLVEHRVLTLAWCLLPPRGIGRQEAELVAGTIVSLAGRLTAEEAARAAREEALRAPGPGPGST